MKHLVLAAIAVFALAACAKPPAESSATPTLLSPVPTIGEITALLESGDATSEDLVTELLRRANARANLNAFITLDAEGALARAREFDDLRAAGNIAGPLHGVPLVVKDNIHVAGLANTAGTPGLASFVPGTDQVVITKLRGAGAIILGKTNLHELAYGITSNNAAHGSVGNPYDPRLIPGGSSGGTAAAISAGMAPAGLGTDTGGSVRIPAALTGIAGFRPSTGRYSSEGVTPISLTRDTIGFLGRNVADLQLLDGVVAGASDAVAPDVIRLGVPRNYYYANVDADVSAVTEATLVKLANAGVVLVETEIPRLAELDQQTGFPIALYETRRDLTAYLDKYATGVTLEQLAEKTASPDVHGVFGAVLDPATVPEDAYQAAMAAREEMRATFAQVFADQDLHALIFPTTIVPARPIATSDQTVELNGEQVPSFPTYIRNTDPASIAALPGISLPVGLTGDGLPVGLELDGPEKSDVQLLAIAAIIEKIVAFEPGNRRE